LRNHLIIHLRLAHHITPYIGQNRPQEAFALHLEWTKAEVFLFLVKSACIKQPVNGIINN